MINSVSLSELVTIRGGGTPDRQNPNYWNGNIPWASVKDLKDILLENTQEFITENGVNNSATNIIPTGTVVVVTRMAVGRACITKMPVAINQDLKALFCSSKLLPQYLLWFLIGASDKLEAQASGATVKGIKIDALNQLKIPLPPLEEQRRIAAILDKADAVRRKRQSAIALTEELLRSAFLEMFGDPVTNPKGWEIKTIEQICNVTKLAGFEYTKHIKYQNSGEIIALRALNVKNGRLKLNEIKFIDRETSNFLKRSKLFKGDVVMTYIGVNIGDVAIIDKDNRYHLAPNVAKISPKSNVNSVYLMRCLEFSKNQLEKYTTNTAKQALNMGKIREITIPLPSLALQDKFASCIEQIQKSAVKHQNSLIESQIFFNALIQKAFRGQL